MTKPSYEELERERDHYRGEFLFHRKLYSDEQMRALEAERREVLANVALARVRGLLQRLFTFARHTEECHAWGYHRPTGSYWADGDEKKCYCPLGKIFREALPSGAESADIGKHSCADELCDGHCDDPDCPKRKRADIGKLDTADNKDLQIVRVLRACGKNMNGGQFENFVTHIVIPLVEHHWLAGSAETGERRPRPRLTLNFLAKSPRLPLRTLSISARSQRG